MILISNCHGRVVMRWTSFPTFVFLLLSSVALCAQTTISTGSIVGSQEHSQRRAQHGRSNTGRGNREWHIGRTA
jgi:hypothetical protein